jgi:hypothetical protein
MLIRILYYFYSAIYKQRYFIIGLCGLCGFYLAFEWFFNQYAMVSVDEFWFAHRAYQFKQGIPYRDFAPYKTVLGYYLLLPPLLLSNSIISALITLKNSLAVFNALMIVLGGFFLSRFFAKKAIFLSIALLFSTEIMLAYSTQIRVDLFAYWLGFFSLLFIVDKRFVLAGLFMGLGLITSQKMLWYELAALAVLGADALLFARHYRYLIKILVFHLAAALVVFSYLGLFSYLSNWPKVFASVFVEASAMYQLDWYAPTRVLFWNFILLYNPLYIMLWPFTALSLFVSYAHDEAFRARCLIVINALVIFACLLPYKQVFPYYFQVSIPVLFALYSAFFTWLLGLFSASDCQMIIIKKIGIYLLTAVMLVLLLFTLWYFSLPLAYLLLAVPLALIGCYCAHPKKLAAHAKTFVLIIALSFVFMGGVYPLNWFVIKLFNINAAYQHANLIRMQQLLDPGEHYVAGIELLFNQDQKIAGLRHLMGPAVDYLYRPNAALKKVMLVSLYEDPKATISSIIADLKQHPPKLYVNNYRMMALPPAIKHSLAKNYLHDWGSIYLYAPRIDPHEKILHLAFSGRYRILLNKAPFIYLNAKPYIAGRVYFLEKGIYSSQANKSYRLRLLADKELEKETVADEWAKMLF